MTNVVIMGCGAVVRRYYAPALRTLRDSGEMRVVGIIDVDTDALNVIGETFPESARLRSVEYIDRLNADVAVVASPPRSHGEHSIAALRAGASVLCEKPMAISSQEGRSMIEAATAARRVLAVNLTRRLLPAARMIKSIIESRALGEIVSFAGSEGGPFAWPVSSTAYFTSANAPGGVLLDIGIHALDLLIWWFGEPETITFEDDAMGGIDVNGRVGMQWSGGATGTLRLSRDWPQSNEYHIQGTRGWLRWTVNEAMRLRWCVDGIPMDLQVTSASDSGADVYTSSISALSFEECFVVQLRNLASAHRNHPAPLTSGEEALRSLQLVERCYNERRLMDMPWLGELDIQRSASRPLESAGSLAHLPVMVGKR